MALQAGPVVVLTREREDNLPLARELASRGVPVLEIPCLATRYLEPAELHAVPAAVAFTSRRGVRGLLRLPLHARLLSGEPVPLVCAVGSATADALLASGFPAGIVAEPPSGESLAEALAARLPNGARVALVRGNLRAGGMDEALERAGFVLLPVVVYENLAPDIPAMAPCPVAAVFAASPSAARRLLGANPWLRKASFVAIGATTEKALRDLGVRSVETAGPDHVAWVKALCAAWQAALRLERPANGEEPE
jgi:uroporphyrinogen-III synthase